MAYIKKKKTWVGKQIEAGSILFSECPVGILPVALRLFEILIVYGNPVPLLMTGSPTSSPYCDPTVSQKFLRGPEHIKAWLAGARHAQMLLCRPVGRVPLPTGSHPRLA